ncbi:uncharacterized protein LOC120134212 [Hibiscus syriacus]|uniref:uncharacterized protein LOC120134212 n=1 Tax=Hibiscus syriacus TaxID=106335 RepID=UPI00192212D7|nr:uncharacterized protein LOC120134212 [Hibiscus syriacus]
MSNTIRVLYDQDGVKLDSFDLMSNEVIRFFKKQLGMVDPNVKCCNANVINDLLDFSLPRGAADALIKDVSDVEIKDAIWGQDNNKSPGPNGFNAYFFKCAWPIVGSDFVAAIRYCFENSFMLPSFNATAVVLVPKPPTETCMISMNQSAFVKGRSIVDNTLLAQELVRGYSRKNISPRCALKIDLQKAFDSLDFEFVRIILHALGLPEKFVGWIWTFITGPSYSIVLNGSLVGYFKAAAKGVFKYHPKCKKMGLPHLYFADDLLVFCKGSMDSVVGVQAVLDIFYSMSGLKLNASKCEIYPAGISAQQCAAIKDITGFTLGSLPVRYLGVPLVSRKLSVKDCHSLIDKIKAKLNIWANKHLSFAGRLQLIRAVLFSMANFWCRQLILPKEIIRAIEQLCSRFFWKGSDMPVKSARDIGGWNKACIVHLIKKLLANEGYLWVAWLRFYVIKNDDFWQLNIPNNVSWSFKCLLKFRPAISHIFTGSVSDLSVRQIWEGMRVTAPKVPWQHLVWFLGRIPKQSVITWIALLNRLPTWVRLQKMGLVIDDVNCVLCGLEAESREHIFFGCSFAKGLWGFILALCGVSRMVSSWDGELAWAIHCLKCKSLIVMILKLAWNAHVYCTWKERNIRLFGGSPRPLEAVLQDIKEAVQIRLSGMPVNRADLRNAGLCTSWGIS